MFRLKGIFVLVCIIMLLVMFYVRCIDNKSEVKPQEKPRERPVWKNEYGPVTFCEVLKDYNHSTLKFNSYIYGDTVIVKDRISRAEIQENHSIFYNLKDYSYSVYIWLDSMNELNEYNEKPTLSVVGDYSKTTMKSNFQAGDNITIHFTVGGNKLDSTNYDPGKSDEGSRETSSGIKIFNVNCTINNNRNEVEEFKIKAGVLSSSPPYDLYQEVMIRVYWEDNEPTETERGEHFLQHYNNTGYFHEVLKLNKIENHIGVRIWETIFDHIEKTIPSDVDLFWHENRRDMEECTMSEGILTPGDVINIIFNFTHFSNPPTGGGLNPGSFVHIKIIPKHGIPTLYEFYLSETFPKEGKWIQL